MESSSSPHRLRILAVDDHQDTAESIAMLLRLWGHEVLWVLNAVAVLEQAAGFSPHLMLIDLAMPKVDGYDLVRQLRRAKQFVSTPMIAVTGFGDEAHRRKAFDAGFDEVLLKPYPPADLKRLIERASDGGTALSGGV
ncbi:MAG TPA: response regulator [Pirellulales bacterium]|nr:response regulator [Pirellulales bacterium]